MNQVKNRVICCGNHNIITIPDGTNSKKQANAKKNLIKIVIIGVITFCVLITASACMIKNAETFLCALEAIVEIATIIANL